MKKLLALGLLFISGAAHAVTYNVSVLSNLSGSGQTGAYGINDSGQVVGNSYNSSTGQVEAVVWNNGVIQSLGFQGIARAVNNSGTVVGEAGQNAVNNKTGDGRAYKWDSTNGYVDLGDLNAEVFRQKMADRNVHIRGIYRDYNNWSRVSMGRMEHVQMYVDALPAVLEEMKA